MRTVFRHSQKGNYYGQQTADNDENPTTLKQSLWPPSLLVDLDHQCSTPHASIKLSKGGLEAGRVLRCLTTCWTVVLYGLKGAGALVSYSYSWKWQKSILPFLLQIINLVLLNSSLNCSPFYKCKMMRYRQLVRSHTVNVGTIRTINSFLIPYLFPEIRVPHTGNK